MQTTNCAASSPPDASCVAACLADLVEEYEEARRRNGASRSYRGSRRLRNRRCR